MRLGRFLVMNGAGAGKGQGNLIALVENETVVASRVMVGRGAAERFAPTVQMLLHEMGWTDPLDKIVAVVGPGSFTGLRASLALASGLARGWSCQCVGVRLGDAMRATIQRSDVTIMCLARRGRVFVDPPQEEPYALAIESVLERSWQALAGDAVVGEDALSELEVGLPNAAIEKVPYAVPSAIGILQASSMQKTLPLTPLYIDPPEAKPPAGGLRPLPIR